MPEKMNIVIKDVILEKWKSKIGYSFNYKDLDELEVIISQFNNHIEYLQQQLQQKENIINKISKKCNKEKGRTDFDIFIELNEQLKTLEGFAKNIDYNLHPIITEAYKCEIKNSIDDLCKNLRYNVVYKDVIKEILDNKGE